jgi:hypothetical protein
MTVSASSAGRRPAAERVIPAAMAAVLMLAILFAASMRVDGLVITFRDEMARLGARHALAVAAREAYLGALSSEKNAMVMTGAAGLDDYASSWMTSVDHVKAAEASLQLVSDPSPRFDEIWGALDSYRQLGEEMYKLKVGQHSGGAIAISTGAADAARNRLDALIEAQVAESAAALDSSTAGFERGLALVAGLATAGLAAAAAAGLWAARR